MKRSSKYLFDKRNRYSVRKLSVGICSVLIGVSLFGTRLVKADETDVTSPPSTTVEASADSTINEESSEFIVDENTSYDDNLISDLNDSKVSDSPTSTITSSSDRNEQASSTNDKKQDEKLVGKIVNNDLQYTKNTYKNIAVVSDESQHQKQELTGWKNDTVNSEISLASRSEALKNIKVKVSDFIGESGKISSSNISYHFIKSNEGFNGYAAGGGKPNSPVPPGNRVEINEILSDDQTENLDPNSLQNIWLSIKIPKDVEKGKYTGTVEVSADGLEKNKLFHYTVNVQDITLSDSTDFKKAFDVELWQNPYRVAEYYKVKPFSKEHLAILKPHMEKYKEIGGYAITATILDDAWAGQTYADTDVKIPSMIKWIKGTDNNFKFDYTDFDKWVNFNHDLGIGDKIVAYSVAPWENKIAYTDEATNERKIATYKVGDKTYETMWKQFLTNFVKHLDEKGWSEQTYIGIDERGFSKTAFDLINSVKTKSGKTLKTAGAMDSFVEKKDLALIVDDLNVGSTAIKSHPKEFEQLVKERAAKGLKTTMYTSTGHYPGSFALSAPGESYWTMLYAAKVGAQGFLRWAYDSWVKDPLKDATHSTFEPGDPFLVYPDYSDAKSPVTKSTARLEKMAEGIRDVNKLLYIKEHSEKLAPEVDKILDSVKPYYEINRGTNWFNKSRFLTDNAKVMLSKDMDSIREKIQNLTNDFIKESLVTDQSHLNDDKDNELEMTDLADYSKLWELSETIPENISDYTEESVKQLEEVYKIVNDLGSDLPKSEQSKVDKVANLLETAIKGLEKKVEEVNQVTPTEGEKSLSVTQPELVLTTETIPYKTVEKENPNLAKGERRVLTKGQVGERQLAKEVVKEGDKVISTKDLSSTTIKEVVDEVVEVGTMEQVSQVSPTKGEKDLSVIKPELVLSTEKVPFKTVERLNDQLAKGQRHIVTKGQDGEKVLVKEVYKEGDKILKSADLPSLVSKEAVDEVVEVGTKVGSPSKHVDHVIEKTLENSKSDKITKAEIISDKKETKSDAPVESMSRVVKNHDEKSLPNTGNKEVGLFLVGMSLLGLGSLAAKRRRG